MRRYRLIIKRIVMPSEYERQTGIRLSKEDTKRYKCVAVDERIVEGKRADIFSNALRSIGCFGGSIDIQPIAI